MIGKHQAHLSRQNSTKAICVSLIHADISVEKKISCSGGSLFAFAFSKIRHSEQTFYLGGAIKRDSVHIFRY